MPPKRGMQVRFLLAGPIPYHRRTSACTYITCAGAKSVKRSLALLIMDIPNHRKPRTKRRHGSGFGHLRYDHKRRPTKIEFVCPLCQSCAIAKEPAFDQGILFAGDTSAHWNQADFSARCPNCFYRAEGLTYQQLPEPFHQVSVAGRTLWAWNVEHLLMLADLLSGRPVAGNPYACLATYAHRGWLQWRAKFSTEITRHIKKHKIEPTSLA